MLDCNLSTLKMQKLKKIFGNPTIIWGKLHFALQIGGSFQRVLKVKGKVKKDVDKFTLW